MNKDMYPGIIVMLFGFAGVILAAIEKAMYDEGLIIDEFITGSITLPDVMALTIILWIIIGIIVVMVRH